MSWADFPSAPPLCSPERDGSGLFVCVSPFSHLGAALALINVTASSEEGAAGMFIPTIQSAGGIWILSFCEN